MSGEELKAAHPNTDQGVTAEDREAAASLIETYWAGGDAAMLKLAASYRAGHGQGVFVRAFRAHRLSSTAALEAEIASLKQRLESAEGVLADARLQLDYLHDKFVKTGTTAALLTRLDIFLQEQEKQPDSVAFLATTKLHFMKMIDGEIARDPGDWGSDFIDGLERAKNLILREETR